MEADGRLLWQHIILVAFTDNFAWSLIFFLAVEQNDSHLVKKLHLFENTT